MVLAPKLLINTSAKPKLGWLLLVKKRGRSVSGVKFDEERTEIFEIPTGIASNLKGYLGEKIVETYFRYKILPELKVQYDYVGMFNSNIAPVRFPSWRGEPPSHQKIASGLCRGVFGSSYGVTWVLPTELRRVYIVKEPLFGHGKYWIKLKVEENGSFEELGFLPRSEKLQEALKGAEEFISGIHYLSKTDMDKLVELYETLSFPNHAGKIGYRPDYLVLTADVVGTQELEAISEMPVRKTFEVPVLRIGKLMLIEAKSGKKGARLDFTQHQKKFLKALSKIVPVEFLLIHVELGDVISLKEAKVSVYRIQDE